MNFKRAVARSTVHQRAGLTSFLKSKIDGRVLRQSHGLQYHGAAPPDLPKDAIVLIAFADGRDHQITEFLDYHRSLGIDHSFLIFNSESCAELPEFVAEASVSVFSINTGNLTTVNLLKTYLLRKYAKGRWILNCETNEFLVFPKMEIRPLKELLRFMEDANRTNIFTPVIDLYAEHPPSPGETRKHLLDSSRALMFDASGYYSSYGSDSEFEIKGGPTLRISHAGDYSEAPYLNRTGLFRQQPGTRLASHKSGVLKPDGLNHVHHWKFPCPTGALLRLYPDPRDGNPTDLRSKLVGPISKPYLGPESLVESRLMESGIWE